MAAPLKLMYPAYCALACVRSLRALPGLPGSVLIATEDVEGIAKSEGGSKDGTPLGIPFLLSSSLSLDSA